MPHFRVPGLSAEEAEEAAHLDRLLVMLGYFTTEVEWALALYQHADELLQKEFKEGGVSSPYLPTYNGWKTIAARNAAFNIYHFGKVLSAIHKRVRLCTTISPFFDAHQMKEARKLFSLHFPKAERIRHAIGHLGEMMQSPEDMEKNRASGSWSEGANTHRMFNSFVINSISGGRLVASREGEILLFELSPATLEHVKQIRAKVLTAAAPIQRAFATHPGTV